VAAHLTRAAVQVASETEEQPIPQNRELNDIMLGIAWGGRLIIYMPMVPVEVIARRDGS
jgi:hypothetical protein